MDIAAARPLEILNTAAGAGNISYDGPVESYQYNGHNLNHTYRYTDLPVEIHVHRNQRTGQAAKAHAKLSRLGHVAGTLTTGASRHRRLSSLEVWYSEKGMTANRRPRDVVSLHPCCFATWLAWL